MIETKVTLASRRAELVEKAGARGLPTEDRVRIQGELSIVNAKIKALNSTETAQLKARAAFAWARAKLDGLGQAGDLPAIRGGSDQAAVWRRTAAIDAWIINVLERGGIKVHRAPSDGTLGFEVPVTIPKKFTASIHTLCAGIRAVARGEDLPPLWDGMCPAGKHGLDFEDQRCDLCEIDAKAKAAAVKMREVRGRALDKANKR